MFFNLECAACVSRGIPFLKQQAREYGDRLILLLIHTAFGHRHYARGEVVPTLQHFAGTFAKLSFPIALDNDGKLAESWGVEGTPHWFVFNNGEQVRSIYGSQANAQTRLEYLLLEMFNPP